MLGTVRERVIFQGRKNLFQLRRKFRIDRRLAEWGEP